jgi:hypothetical protein
MFRITCRLRPKLLQWISSYTMIVRPTVTYSATAWWPGIKHKTSRVELSKLQSLEFLMLQEVWGLPLWLIFRSSLDSPPPVHLQLEPETRTRNLKTLLQWTIDTHIRRYGHVYMSQGIKEHSTLQLGTDGHVCDRHCTDRLERILKMVYVVQNSQNFSGLFPSTCIPKNTTFRKLDLFPFSGEVGEKTPTQLGPLERAKLNQHRPTDEVSHLISVPPGFPGPS